MGRWKKQFPTDELIKTAQQVDLARLAAFIDGEGGIYLKPGSSFKGKYKTLYLAICVINTDPRLVQWCVRTFGGKIQRRLRKVTSTRVMNRDCYEWELYCKDAEMVLRACMPYFIIKKELAELALAHQATLNVGGKPVSPYKREQRQLIREQMKIQRFKVIEPDDDIDIRSRTKDVVH